MTAPVSIVIPIRDEAKTLPELLASLERQTLLPQEVIIVDASSTDGGRRLIETWWASKAWIGGDCRVLPNPGRFPGAGRNVGIKAAKGEWIAFLDAGIDPQPNWLSALLIYAEEHKAKAVFGVGRFCGHGAIARAVCALSYGEGAISQEGILPASLFHREVIEKVGLFSPDLLMQEDTQWRAKYKVVYGEALVNTNALVEYHHFPKSFADTVRKWFRSGTYAVRAGVHKGQQTLYLLALLSVLALALVFGIEAALLFLVGAVFMIRGCFLPMTRSKPWHWWKGESSALIAALFLCLVMDPAKGAGFLFGYVERAKERILSKT